MGVMKRQPSNTLTIPCPIGRPGDCVWVLDNRFHHRRKVWVEGKVDSAKWDLTSWSYEVLVEAPKHYKHRYFSICCRDEGILLVVPS